MSLPPGSLFLRLLRRDNVLSAAAVTASWLSDRTNSSFHSGALLLAHARLPIHMLQSSSLKQASVPQVPLRLPPCFFGSLPNRRKTCGHLLCSAVSWKHCSQIDVLTQKCSDEDTFDFCVPKSGVQLSVLIWSLTQWSLTPSETLLRYLGS
jgi:hypothetical protein